MFGLLNINKPSGITSRAVVNHIERLTPNVKVGHAGTLDPLATGVLLLGVGPATRLLEYIQRMSKSYRATFLLGQHSETDDIDGTIKQLSEPVIPGVDSIDRHLEKFKGTILQRPPQYSAIKVRGRRAYDLARSGKHVDLSAREVTIHSLKRLHYDYPQLELEVVCSSGTYIRALGRDLAHRLETVAVLSSLCRTSVGEFDHDQAASLEKLSQDSIETFLLSPKLAVPEIHHITLSRDHTKEVFHGRSISGDFQQSGNFQIEEAAAFFEGQLVAILHRDGVDRWVPHKVFSQLYFADDTSGKL